MVWIVGGMLSLVAWEWPNLRAWDRAERAAFWVFWSLMLAWAIAVQRHVAVPTIIDLTERMFRPWARRLLTPMPDFYW